MKALGLIEVNGYLTAVIASDAALKAANVTLIGIEVVKSGISCVKLTGDVGAINASVEAGEAAAKQKGLFRSSSVIPRLSDDIAKLLLYQNKIDTEESVINNEITLLQKEEAKLLDVLQKINKLDKKPNYKNMKVEQLKNHVRKIKSVNLTNKQIKAMRKEELINILEEYYTESKEGEI